MLPNQAVPSKSHSNKRFSIFIKYFVRSLLQKKIRFKIFRIYYYSRNKKESIDKTRDPNNNVDTDIPEADQNFLTENQKWVLDRFRIFFIEKKNARIVRICTYHPPFFYVPFRPNFDVIQAQVLKNNKIMEIFSFSFAIKRQRSGDKWVSRRRRRLVIWSRVTLGIRVWLPLMSIVDSHTWALPLHVYSSHATTYNTYTSTNIALDVSLEIPRSRPGQIWRE
jgi:hypothetical protein